MMRRSTLDKYNPAVPNRWLLLVAGCVWAGVGAFLCYRALTWLDAAEELFAAGAGAVGIAVAVAASRLMFDKIALRNVGRIEALPERTCLFAFTAWRGYAIIGVMMLIGVALRDSSLPRQYLAPLYLAMGGSLVISSSVFIRSFLDRFA